MIPNIELQILTARTGGAPISDDVLQECIEKTKQRLKEVHEIINQALESK